jgi:HSP20 family protein
MTIVKFNTDPIRTFTSLFDRLFEDYTNTEKFARFLPSVDLVESPTQYELHIALPGIEKKDVNIEIQNGQLVISGERKFVNESKDKTYHTIETRYGHFYRSFDLPDNIDTNKIEAEFKNGMLQISLPKNEKLIHKAKIEIK